MNPISNTAYYCCGVRMDDADMPNSVCNDRYAQRLMDEHGRRVYEPFKSERMPNISNITRCRIIDDMLAGALRANRLTTVISIGAGFDTRSFRLDGGRWIEVDEAPIVNLKNERLPVAESPNELARIPIEFATESLIDKLSGTGSDQPIVIVIEGVFMYLEPAAIESTVKQVQRLFPKHTLLCDLMSKRFFERFGAGVHAKLVAAGAHFAARPEDPVQIFRDNGYVESACIPTFARAAELGVLWERARIPRPIAWLLGHVLVKDLHGYAVYRLDHGR